MADALKLSNADRVRLEQALGGDAIAEHLSARAGAAASISHRAGAVSRPGDAALGGRRARHGAACLGACCWRWRENWQRPRFPLTGRDVMAAGVPEGPEVGRMLAAVEDWWVEGDFAAGRERPAAIG